MCQTEKKNNCPDGVDRGATLPETPQSGENNHVLASKVNELKLPLYQPGARTTGRWDDVSKMYLAIQ